MAFIFQSVFVKNFEIGVAKKLVDRIYLCSIWWYKVFVVAVYNAKECAVIFANF